MNDKKRQRHIAYEVLVILGQLALLTYITRLWPILLLVILGIFVAALRLLFLSSQKVEPVRPLPSLPPPRQPPTERDLQSADPQCQVPGSQMDLGESTCHGGHPGRQSYLCASESGRRLSPGACCYTAVSSGRHRI